jgi:hypothetical protein
MDGAKRTRWTWNGNESNGTNKTMKCYKQGCVSPVYGEETVRVEEERVEHESPQVVGCTNGEPVIREYYIERFGQCVVCGAVYDL